MSIIEVNKLNFSYDQRVVLEDISLKIEKGKFMSLLGCNGAGKSTLFKCMLGLLPNYSGEIIIDGKNIKDMSISDIAKKIAYIPQHTSPAFNYSVEDIVLMGTTASLRPLSTPRKEEIERTNFALEKIGIEDLRQRCFHLLSGGEKQLVIIARAIAQNAEIIMLDEPTASLDLGNQIKVLEEIRSLSSEGYTIIQTTHNPDHAYVYSDTIAIIKDGKVLVTGNAKEIINNDTMTKLYGIDINVVSLFDDMVRICTNTF